MLLKAENLSVCYPGFHFHPVSFSMEEGEILAVIGESGSGKTTLAKAVTCLLGSDGELSGSVTIDGHELVSMPEKQRKKLRSTLFSMAFQNAAQYLNPTMTLFGHLQEIFDREVPRKEQPGRMASLMARVGLEEADLARYPKELSGGMAQKFLLACAVALSPRLVVLDEPTSSLDKQSVDEFVELIRRLNREENIAFLLITHDLHLAKLLSRRMLVLYEGHLMEMGDTEKILDEPRHPYTRGLLQASISLNLARDIWGIPPARRTASNSCPFYGRCTQSVEVCGKCPPRLTVHPDGRAIACHRGGIVKTLEGLSIGKSFGKRRILDGCNVRIHSGEAVALVGASGAGKTTLARILSGFDGNFEGNVLFEGEKADFKTLHKTKGGIQLVMQDCEDALNPRMTVFEAAAEPLRLSGGDVAAGVEKALLEVGLPTGDFLKKTVRTLSGGQKQRLCLARALTMEPKLLIADEPTAMLDPSTCANVLRLLKSLQNSRGFSMLMVTHDLDSAVKISDSILLLQGGGLTRVLPSDHVKSNLNELLK